MFLQDLQETDIPQEVFSRLDALAAKLGVAVDQLWEVLVSSQSRYVFQPIGWFIASLMVMLVAYVVGTWVAQLDQDEDSKRIALMIGVILAAFVFLGVVVDGIAAIQHLIYPEYYALQEILQVLK